MCLFLALATTIVTEDRYVVAKLPAGALAVNDEAEPDNDYRASKPNRERNGAGQTRRPRTTRPSKDILGKILNGAVDFFGR